MSGRKEYFLSVVEDCLQVVEELDVAPADRGAVMAALILSDSLNGIRKAVLTPSFVLDRRSKDNT